MRISFGMGLFSYLFMVLLCINFSPAALKSLPQVTQPLAPQSGRALEACINVYVCFDYMSVVEFIPIIELSEVYDRCIHLSYLIPHCVGVVTIFHLFSFDHIKIILFRVPKM